jgi:Leucine-rich repeat (LRR) protein
MSRWILLALLPAIIIGCGNYDLTVNEKVVYTPRPLLSDFTVADPALRTCIEQAITEQQVTRPNELLTLSCRDVGINKLEGLGLFTGLRQLTLSANQISDLTALSPLSSLESLDLSDNTVTDPVPLYELLSLRTLDLSGNPRLQCPGRNALFQLEQLILPEHCSRR